MSVEDSGEPAERKGSLAKSHLADAVAENIGLGLDDASVIVEVIFGSIAGALHRGEKVEIRNFGAFSSHRRRARTGRNPKSGVRVHVPAKRVAVFKPSKTLLHTLNKVLGI